jgi:hypothetical protein
MRQQTTGVLRGLCMAAAIAMTMTTTGARAQTFESVAATANPNFGSRTENPDGSVALSVGRRLSEWEPAAWEAKVGTDVKLSSDRGSSASENFLSGLPADQSSGAVWAKVIMPSVVPSVWDKTAVEARVDAGQEQGKLGATLSRSVPIGRSLSVSLQNTYSVTRSLADRVAETPSLPIIANPLPANAVDGSATWAAGQSVRLNIDPSGTALSVGGARSSADEQWHNKLSLEQSLFGPLKVTTSIEDAGTTASKKSISAAFKRVW